MWVVSYNLFIPWKLLVKTLRILFPIQASMNFIAMTCSLRHIITNTSLLQPALPNIQRKMQMTNRCRLLFLGETGISSWDLQTVKYGWFTSFRLCINPFQNYGLYIQSPLIQGLVGLVICLRMRLQVPQPLVVPIQLSRFHLFSPFATAAEKNLLGLSYVCWNSSEGLDSGSRNSWWIVVAVVKKNPKSLAYLEHHAKTLW